MRVFSFEFPAAVVQLKTITSALSADEGLSNSTIEKIGILQKLLVQVVSITCSYINLNSNVCEKAQSFSHSLELTLLRDSANSIESPSGTDAPVSEGRLRWHQKAIVSVMEAGGLNWLVGKVCSFMIFQRFTCSYFWELIFPSNTCV